MRTAPFLWVLAANLMLTSLAVCTAQEPLPAPPIPPAQTSLRTNCDSAIPAATPSAPSVTAPECVDAACCASDLFATERWSLQFLTGYYPMSGLGGTGTIGTLGADHKYHYTSPQQLDLLPQTLRLGWAYRPGFLDDTWFQGRSQVLVEYTVDPVTRDFGNFVTGPSLLLRHNFEHPGCRLVPYVQAGAGIVLDDAYHDMDQRLIGGPIEFLLQAQFGLHYSLNSSWSLDAEGGYRHISNADMYSRNVGVNSLGGSIGLTYSFGQR